MEYYSAIEKNDILPFTTIWMDLKGITLSEISQTEKDRQILYDFTYMLNLKDKIHEQHNKTETEL